jgi:hypothetical protein
MKRPSKRLSATLKRFRGQRGEALAHFLSGAINIFVLQLDLPAENARRIVRSLADDDKCWKFLARLRAQDKKLAARNLHEPAKNRHPEAQL